MSQWQDISSAPKDGTVIDLWRGLNSFRLTNTYWRDGKWQWKHYRYDEADDQITHWMPLPAPPASTSKMMGAE